MTIFQFSSDFYQREALGGRGEIVTGGDFPAVVEKNVLEAESIWAKILDL